MGKKKGKKKTNGGDRTKSGPTNKQPNVKRQPYFSQTKNRIKFQSLKNDLKAACNQLLNKYPYVICCGMGEVVHTHGCFEHELQNEYHWVVEQVYSKNYGFPVQLTNSSHSSNKVCPQGEIMKNIKQSRKNDNNFAEFLGGQYDFMAVVFEPFDDAVIVQKKDGASHHSGGRGKDINERMEWHSRGENEIWWYASQKAWYGKVNGKIKRLGRNHDYAIEKVA